MEEKREVVLSTVHEHGNPAIVDVAGWGLMLTDDLDDGGAIGLSLFVPTPQVADEGWLAVGGRLPEAAASCEVLDFQGEWREMTTGSGFWVGMVSGRPGVGPIARFRDASAELVPAELPADFSRTPAPEVEEDCFACGARAWELVAGSAEVEPLGYREEFEAAVCTRCGYAAEVGMLVSLETPEDFDPEQAREAAASHRASSLERLRPRLAAARFDIYAEAGGPYELAGHGGSSGDGLADPFAEGLDGLSPEEIRERLGEYNDGMTLTSVVVGAYDSPVRVTSELEEEFLGTEEELWDTLEGLVGEEVKWPESRAAIAVNHDHVRRVAHTAMRDAVFAQLSISLDGRPVAWEAARLGSHWVAVRTVGTTAITVSATGVEPEDIEIVRLTDAPRQLVPPTPPPFTTV